MDLLILLIFAIIIPLLFLIIGIVFLCSNKKNKTTIGVTFILGGVIFFGLCLLIGLSICSNGKGFSNMN
jgi:hypothetical protein